MLCIFSPQKYLLTPSKHFCSLATVTSSDQTIFCLLQSPHPPSNFCSPTASTSSKYFCSLISTTPSKHFSSSTGVVSLPLTFIATIWSKLTLLWQPLCSSTHGQQLPMATSSLALDLHTAPNWCMKLDFASSNNKLAYLLAKSLKESRSLMLTIFVTNLSRMKHMFQFEGEG